MKLDDQQIGPGAMAMVVPSQRYHPSSADIGAWRALTHVAHRLSKHADSQSCAVATSWPLESV